MVKNSLKNKSGKKDIFEEKLKDMAKEGDLSFVLDDLEPVTLSSKERRMFYNTVKDAFLRKRIIEARNSLPEERLSLGRHLQWIRKKGRISKKDVAQVLKKEIDFIDRLESGSINPLKIIENELIEIMQLFRVSISEFLETVKAHHAISVSRTGKKYSMARSSFGAASDSKQEALSHAFDAVLHNISKKENTVQDTMEIDEKYIEELREELRKRGEFELL